MTVKGKAIIDGRRYDSETAEEVAHRTNHLSTSDFGHLRETLYRTEKGVFFLVGGGGPMTKYSVSVGSNGSGGSTGNVQPMTDDEAMQWLERHDKVSALEEHFGDQIEHA